MRTPLLCLVVSFSVAAGATPNQEIDDAVSLFDLESNEGWFVGYSSGAGVFDCLGCASAGLQFAMGTNLQLGGFTSQRSAIVLDVAMTVATKTPIRLTFAPTIGGQRWISGRLWLQGGVGVGVMVTVDDTTDVAFGLAGTATAGIGLVEKENYTVEFGLTGTFVKGDEQSSVFGSLWIGIRYK